MWVCNGAVLKFLQFVLTRPYHLASSPKSRILFLGRVGCLLQSEILFPVRIPMCGNVKFSLDLLAVFEGKGAMPAVRIFLPLAVDCCCIMDISSIIQQSCQLIHSAEVMWSKIIYSRCTYRIRIAWGASCWSRAVAYANATSDCFLCLEIVLPA